MDSLEIERNAMIFHQRRLRIALLCGIAVLGLGASPGSAQDPSEVVDRGESAATGPHSATILADGIGLERELPANARGLEAGAPWTMSTWIRPSVKRAGRSVVVQVGRGDAVRAIVMDDGNLAFWNGRGEPARTTAAMPVDRWTFVTASSDGRSVRLFADGVMVGTSSASPSPIAPVLALAPAAGKGSPNNAQHFGGDVFELRLQAKDASPSKSPTRPPEVMLAQLVKPGVGWEWQEKQWRGYFQPQDYWTLPKSATPPTKPVARPLGARPSMTRLAENRWQIGDWDLAFAEGVSATGAQLSATGFPHEKWFKATVPGTVLTTLVDRGVYPDPAYGLNNMAIPESLARQDYWYRTEFDMPSEAGGKRFLVFKGINYAAEIWVNGTRVGDVRGAFVRGQFDVSPLLRAGRNAVAVKIVRPPHPGIPHEESIAAGPGMNGGNLTIDGPTFVAAEGWDWIPGVRDRNMGIWQPVELQTSEALRIGDTQVVTDLPLPRTDSAAVTVRVPVTNLDAAPVASRVTASFDGVAVSKDVVLAPGSTTVEFAPADFPPLNVRNPRLWWPNGYGPQNLYTLKVSASQAGRPSDSRTLRFGIRELSYGLSLFDRAGSLRRVSVSPTDSKERLVDPRHEAIKQTPEGWVESLTPAGEISPAVRPLEKTMALPHLTVFVNGVKIAARGGNWGMDDFMKRVPRERMEPFFKLHKYANVNIIRNWVGQNTEDVFYDLADEYGMLITNDFFMSTQNFQVEPEDPQLFLANARDVISRYRNHPSVLLWFGRNEGVPPPLMNEGMDSLVHQLDGTRLYMPSSNVVGVQGSGPYNYRPPVGYFTNLASGFSVETGSPSLNTLEALKAMMPKSELWPISDTLAYHDWHFGGNGDVKTFMDTMDVQLGKATSLEDFERKAQLMNVADYKAIFEGMSAHLWTKNSGRMLWMTHPAWPSNHWQIYSYDYDTPGAYFGTKSALEPMHAQMNLPDYSLAVVNTTLQPRSRLRLTTKVVSGDGRVLLSDERIVDAPANTTTTLPALRLQPVLDRERLVFVSMTLVDDAGKELSRNFYWQGADDTAYRKLNDLVPQKIDVKAAVGAKSSIGVTVTNRSDQPVLGIKMTVLDARGERVLPAYYGDNYLNLLPGETRTVDIQCGDAPNKASAVSIRGWNVVGAVVRLR
ncbi:LamG-like jellyroll fold domain-containing protein [Sphingomonas sp. PvP056]|uniref:glycosyl hydrolase 2 galactose-binding domain-containing protein n=1 Tax=Sphingomonas sp. PvP056 TaxID=3156392 RepID=UPI0033945165